MIDLEKEFPGYYETGDTLVDLVNLLKWMQEYPHDGPSDRVILDDGTEIIL